jgi:hypothetical protein
MSKPLRPTLLGTLALAVAAAWPGVGAGQEVVCGPRGVTLRGWEERARVIILDREGSFDGRFSSRGILQRYHPLMDAEYQLDVISSSFPLDEECSWYRADSGARFWAGSIDHLRLIQVGQIKARVPLGSHWGVRVEHLHEETLRARRNLLRLGFERDLAGGAGRVFLSGTPIAIKPEADLEMGASWFPGEGEVTVAVGALDVFSDVVYQVLGVGPALSDSVLDYLARPYTLRAFGELPLHPRLRMEAFGLRLTPTRVRVEPQGEPWGGFVQDEGYAYAGGLVEWTPGDRTALGALATWKRGHTERAPAEGEALAPTDFLEVLETSRQLGAFLIHDPLPQLRIRGWLVRAMEEETRESLAGPSSYQKRTVSMRLDLTYRGVRGLHGELGLDGTARSGEGVRPVPPIQPLLRSDYRLRGDLGWRFGERALFVLGANLDLDSGGFDGGHGRFSLSW